MTQLSRRIEPLLALVYNPDRSGPLESLIAPPYDLIGPRLQDELYQRSPYNIVRLELNRDPDRYRASAAVLEQWRAEGVVQPTPAPALYLYTQSFEYEGRAFKRDGFIVRLRLEDFSPGRILPHEQTFAAPRADRLRLLEATRLNVSSIFALYPGADSDLEELRQDLHRRPPWLAVRDADQLHELRAIANPTEIQRLQRAFDSTPLLIADGHHRYATALTYQAQRRAGHANPAGLHSFDYTLATLVADNDPGLLILPTHRVIRQLSPDAVYNFLAHAHRYFAVEDLAGGADLLLARLRQGARPMLGVALRGDPRLLLLTLRNRAALAALSPGMVPELRDLDVTMLHSLVLGRLLGIDRTAVSSAANIEYTVDGRAAVAAVGAGHAAAAFLLNPPSVADLQRVSEAGATMPEKSTYFYPKLVTGLVMNPLDD